jgi:hypothetical protein
MMPRSTLLSFERLLIARPVPSLEPPVYDDGYDHIALCLRLVLVGCRHSFPRVWSILTTSAGGQTFHRALLEVRAGK